MRKATLFCLTLSITLLLILSASCAFAATEPFNCPNCNGVGTGVASSYIEYPTCVKGGTFRMFCNSCQTSYIWSGDNIDPDAHNYVYTVANATCTLDGHQGNRCTLCGKWADDATVIPATGHKWRGYTYSGTPGKHYQTCRNKGCDATQTLSCNYDNYGYRDYRGGVVHGHMCLDCWNWVDHNASGGTASCVAKAVCWCGLSYGELGNHVPGTPVKTPATCTTNGKIETKCTVCQTVLSTETIGKTGHNTKLTGTTAATCTQQGVETYTCQNNGCSYTETKTSPALGHTYVGLWQVGDSDTHYRNCYRCGAGRQIAECTYLPLVIDDVQYQVCPVCGRFHSQKLEAVSEATTTLATGSKPGSTLVRMLAQPFGANELRYPVIMTAIFEANGYIAEPAQNVSGITVSLPLNTTASFKLMFVRMDDVTGQLVWTDVPYTLANGALTFTVEEMGLFLFVAE